MNQLIVFLENGHYMYFDAPLNANHFKYPSLHSKAENSAMAELDFHKMRIFCDCYYRYHTHPRLFTLIVNGANIKVETIKEPSLNTCIYIMDIWQGVMGFFDGECEIIKSKNIK